MITDRINFKQPKYVLPLIIFLPLLVTAYFVFDMFDTELAKAPTSLETTEYLNSNLPQAQVKGDGIGDRYESMLKSFGRIQDYSAVESIERGDSEGIKEAYSSKYSDEDLALLDADAERKAQELEKLRNMQERIRQGADKGSGMVANDAQDVFGEEERLNRSRQRQDEAMAELHKALAEARLKGQKGLEPATTDSVKTPLMQQSITEGKVESSTATEGAVKGIDENDAAKDVVKAMNKSSDYFFTIAENEPEPNLIKAIIDENITAVNGSRVRLRLLDDVMISDCMINKGSYLYATVSGFGSQRVKGNVQSILVEDELVKVNLSIYDTDGLEGLYVPSSKFRETAQNVAGSAISGNMNMNTTGGGNMLQQWGMQAINNAYQKTTNAISSTVKKNKAKLKYGSFVYLVNGRDKRNDN
ncbi:conjugative transposon protein TraM [Bacteroides cellulosilyticus]|uniref:conjugative transposon protein TraM n=1 Tax=Bacteroides cellulosilyticus TaxID=246787 RepID=UPI003566982C